MSESLGTAFLVLMVGMITVFVVLLLVVLSGQLLIRLVNRFLPAPSNDYGLVARKAPFQTVSSSSTSSSKIAALVAAVDIVTKGKGKITKIEKLDK